MRKLVIHLAIACCTFGLSVFLTSILSWWPRADIPVQTLYVRVSESAPTISSIEPGLLEIYRDYAQAQTNHDIAFFESVEADDYVLFSDGKALSRTDTIEWLKSSSADITYKLEDVNMEIYGDAAIVTGRITASHRYGYRSSWRWIDVCVRRDGRWQIQNTTQID
jgi:ketosteroid isomerase-like protein